MREDGEMLYADTMLELYLEYGNNLISYFAIFFQLDDNAMLGVV